MLALGLFQGNVSTKHSDVAMHVASTQNKGKHQILSQDCCHILGTH